MVAIHYQGQALPAQQMAEVSTFKDDGTEVLCLHNGQYYLQRTLQSGPVFIHRVIQEGVQLWQEAVSEGCFPERKESVNPEDGSFCCELDAERAHGQPTLRYLIDVNPAQAALRDRA